MSAQIRAGVLTLFIGSVFLVWTIPDSSSAAAEKYLQIHFLDVGQGDATLIETPDGVQVLIDGGPNGTVLRQLAERMSFFDRSIDMVIGTHPDTDHIGGLIDVFARYAIATILVTENTGSSATARTYQDAAAYEGAEVVYARTGQVFELGASTTLRVLYPESDPADMESNASSIVVQLVYGDTEVLLTGDSPKRIEEYLVRTQQTGLQSDILKIGHHGSRTSTSELFLEEVGPQFAIISAAKDSRYGHPHVEVTDMLSNYAVETSRTAEEGTITFLSDGVHTWKK